MTKIRSGSSGRIRDRRGAGGGGGSAFGGGGGGGGFPIPMKAGGGLVGVLVLVVVIALTQFGGGDNAGAPGLGVGDEAIDDEAIDDAGAADARCVTEIEQVVCGAVDDVSLYWEEQFPVSFNGAFSGTDTVFFSGSTQTQGCGGASAESGPFYCPVDQLVYFDLDFLEQLQADFGATGDLAAQYIVAHEYGHHVQNITGISDLMRAAQERSPSLANELSVSLELQADCFAGAWASSVAERGLFDREGEIEEALGAAEAVGDDRILESAGRSVDRDSFTHGSAEERRTWFETGFESADPEACTTFDGSLAPPA